MDKKVRNNHKDSAGVEDPQGCNGRAAGSGQAGRQISCVWLRTNEQDQLDGGVGVGIWTDGRTTYAYVSGRRPSQHNDLFCHFWRAREVFTSEWCVHGWVGGGGSGRIRQEP